MGFTYQLFGTVSIRELFVLEHFRYTDYSTYLKATLS